MELKQQLLDLLQAGKSVTLTWNGGGDEEFFVIFIDEQESDSDFNEALTDHLMLNGSPINGTGEFTLEGKGSIIIANNEIVLDYCSDYSGIYYEYDEETGEEIELDEEATFTDAGVFTLFQL